jgi:hypothetical protein
VLHVHEKVFTSLNGSLVYIPITHPVSHSYMSPEKLKLINMVFCDSVSVLQELIPVAIPSQNLHMYVGLRHSGSAPLGIWISKLSGHSCSSKRNFKYTYRLVSSGFTDLSPLHLHVWGHLKGIVFECKAGINDELHHQMLDVVRHVNDLMLLYRVWIGIGKGIRMCTQFMQKYAAISQDMNRETLCIYSSL